MKYNIKEFAKYILLLLFLLYISIGLIFFFWQNYFIYFPDDKNFRDCEKLEDYEALVNDNTRFYYKNQSEDNVVVYYHGNAGSACDRGRFKEIFEESGHSVIFAEYTGYSNENRRPTKELILKNVKNINGFVDKKGYENVILYGQSIGSGPASYHAYISEKAESVVLTSSFARLSDVVNAKIPVYPAKLLLRGEYYNLKWLREFDGEIMIFHGKEDRVIPADLSRELHEGLESSEYVLIEGKGHNNIWQSREFKEKLVEFIKEK